MNYEANADTSEEIADEYEKKMVKATKMFKKLTRQIYKLISYNPKVRTTEIAEKTHLSHRQVQRYMKELQDLHKIARLGGSKLGHWEITDEDYEGFFDRI